MRELCNIQKSGLLPSVLDLHFRIWLDGFLSLKKIFLLLRLCLRGCGLLCVFLPCPCLRLMSQPLRGWHWTVVPFWTIALARVSGNSISSVLALAALLLLNRTNKD